MKSLSKILSEIDFAGPKKSEKHIWDPLHKNIDSTHQAVSFVKKDPNNYSHRKGFDPNRPGERNLPEDKEENKSDVREELAKYAHEVWSGWMKHMIPKIEQEDNQDWLDRWTRQMETSYDDLSEEEKESDRKEADKILAIVDVKQK